MSLTETLDCTKSIGTLVTVSVVLPTVSPRSRYVTPPRLPPTLSSAAMLLSSMLRVISAVTSTSVTEVRPSPPNVASTMTSVL